MAKSPRVQHPLQRLLRYGRDYRRQINWAIACSILNKVFDLAPPVLIGMAVDVVVQQQDSLIARFGVADIRGQFIILAILTLVIWGLESLFEYAYARLWRSLAQAIQHHLRLDAYAHLQNLELAYFEERSTGGLLAILSDDINQLERFLDVGANELLHLVTTVVVISGAFFILAPQVAGLAILPIPFILWGSISFQKRLAPATPLCGKGWAYSMPVWRITLAASLPSKASPPKPMNSNVSAKTAKPIAAVTNRRSPSVPPLCP